MKCYTQATTRTLPYAVETMTYVFVCTNEHIYIWGVCMCGCCVNRNYNTCESLSVFRYKCDPPKARLFHCNSQSIMQIQLNASDVK